MRKPKAKKKNKTQIFHGHELEDNYFWLRDKNWKNIVAGKIEFENPEVLDYISQENSYTQEIMKDEEKIQKEISQEVLSRINEDYESYPEKKGEYLYFKREVKGKNYPIFLRSKDGVEEVVFDLLEEKVERYSR